MNRQDCIAALGAIAAERSSTANELEQDAQDESGSFAAELLHWAEEARFLVGTCLAAINHLNGASPE